MRCIIGIVGGTWAKRGAYPYQVNSFFLHLPLALLATFKENFGFVIGSYLHR